MDQNQHIPHSYPAPLTDAEIETILDDLDGFETPQEVVAQRMHVRLPYHEQVAVVCEAGGGVDADRVRFTAVTRDLSDGGLGLIAPHALPEGTPCMVTLVGPHGQEVSVTGKVALCDPLEGRAHFWGVKFDQLIHAASFLPTRQAG
ncbi:MAG: PilZ domain-containing protein [Planctomycetota bacterium]